MLKTYRKRFVALNMFLIGILLLVALIAVTVYTYHDYTEELEKTMRQILDPLDSIPRLPQEAPKDIPEDSRDDIKTKPDGKPNSEAKEKPEKKSYKEDKKIITVRYYNDTDEYSIRSYDLSVKDESIRTAAQTAAEQTESFGILPGYRLFYYRDIHENGYCVALTTVSYFHGSMIKLMSVLFLIFILSMILFYILSYNISKVAVRPLEQTIALEKQFVADISHELKTPLTVILANNSILKENKNLPVFEQMKWIENTDNAARNMMNMVENMLTLSTVESAAHISHAEKTDLSAIVTKAALQMESVAFEKGIEPEIRIEENIFINGNSEYVQMICSSLIDNALKYEPSGGKISIFLTSKKKIAYFSVHNYGNFISSEDIPHVFERFYRSSTSRGKHNGHGLGLAIVKQSAEAMGGNVCVQSSPEKGTVFTVSFPLM